MTTLVIVLAATSMVGIFGLLLSSGIWDIIFLVLAALPLLVGSGSMLFRYRRQS